MSNIRSLDDLLGRGGDDDRKHNDYYAGGEKSGQLIRGAPDDDDDDEDEDEDQVGSIFKQARQFGAVNGTADDLPQQASGFQGVGRTLAGPTPGQAPPQAQQNEAPIHQVTFYRNGIFTVDDGEPRQVSDPANFAFINSISKGECPRELDPGTSAVPVTVNLIRKEEDFVPPKASTTFTGQGRTLGGSSSSSSAAPSSSSRPAASREWAGVDESKPTTSLQLRLHDGSRLVAKFNHSQTIGDVRSFIHAARADMPASFSLATSFPPKVLDDDSVTLEAAGLLNAVLIQRL